MRNGWKRVALEDVAEIRTGLAKGKRDIKNPVQRPYLRVANVQDGYLNLKTIKTIEVNSADVNRYALKRHDVLMTEGGDFDKLGRGTVWRDEVPGCLHQNHIFAVRVDAKRLCPFFLAFLAASPEGKRYFAASSKQSTNLASINSSQLKQFPVPLPPLAEQRRIAKILRSWDEAIEKTERLRDAKQQQIDGFVEQFYSSKEGNFHAFGDYLTESHSTGTDGSRAQKLTVRLYGKGVVAKAGRSDGSADTKYFIRRSGQLMYGKLDFLNGAFGIVPEHLDGYESTLDLPAFDIAPTVNAQWLLEYLRRPAYYTRQTSLARGQRIARRVNPADFLSSEFRVPSRQRQDLVANAIGAMRHDLLLTLAHLDALAKQKRGLMQKLLTGEWSVTVAKPQENAA